MTQIESAATESPVGKWKPYPAYKDSGVEWLGKIPEHWKVERLKNTVLACLNGIWGDEPINDGGDMVCIRVADFDRTRNRVVDTNLTLRSIPSNQRQNRVLERGDLLLEKSGGGELQPVGTVVLYDLDTLAVCSNFIARMLVIKGFDPTFLCYLHSVLYSARLNIRSIKQNTGIQNLDSYAYLCEKVCLPTLPEQQAIAVFLDRETARINALIAKKERLIELLQEKRAALISHAVTKGLDSSVPTKESGIEWIERIPAHWEIKRVRDVTELLQTGPFGSQLHSSEYSSNGIPVINPSHLKDGRIYPDWDCTVDDEIRFRLVRHELYEGDIVIARRGEMGRCALVTEMESGWLCGTGSLLMRPKVTLTVPSLLNKVLSNNGVKDWLLLESVGSTMDNLNTSILSRIPLPIPPLSEQQAIIDFIDHETAKIDALITRIQEGIEKLREYSAALISAAVTGKIDVREEITLPGDEDLSKKRPMLEAKENTMLWGIQNEQD